MRQAAVQLIGAGAQEDADECRKLAAQLTPMLIPPWNGMNTRFAEVTTAVKYQTLWTDVNWIDKIKLKCILESELPEDFSISIYYAESREMLTLHVHSLDPNLVRTLFQASTIYQFSGVNSTIYN